jgi:hypothetical protein
MEALYINIQTGEYWTITRPPETPPESELPSGGNIRRRDWGTAAFRLTVTCTRPTEEAPDCFLLTYRSSPATDLEDGWILVSEKHGIGSER